MDPTSSSLDGSRAKASSSKSTSSTPYTSISSSSFIDLKAELNKRQDDFAKSKHLGTTTLGKRPTSSTPSLFSKRNKGLASRSARDQATHQPDSITDARDPARAKAQLEKKALLYEKIKRGKTGGLKEEKIEQLLVDFDAKRQGENSDAESSEEDESMKVPERPLEEDPLVEYTDEFGRTRYVPRSEVPRGVSALAAIIPVDESNVRYGDQQHFPVYEPSPDLLAARAAAIAASEPLVSHYDAGRENRAKGAGFYAFSSEEEERQKQMAALKREREETEKRRKEGEVKVDEKEREKEERRKKVEEKRKELEKKKEARKALAAAQTTLL